MPVLYLCRTLCLLQVFSRGELGLIAELCVKHDELCISDEVYEWLVYDGKQHIRIGTGRAGLGAARGWEWGFHWHPLEIPGAACMHGRTRHESPLEVFCCASISASKPGPKQKP